TEGWIPASGGRQELKEPAGATILIVEDEAIVAELYSISLERAGYRVVVAGDGLAGLEAVSAAKPDFIFLDIRMPKLDGVEVLKRLQAGDATRHVPVVMLSNFDEPGLVKQTLDLGAKEYLVKAGLLPADLAV